MPAKSTVMDGNSQFSYAFREPGSHQVTFTGDVDNHVAESNERNNSQSVPVKIE